jgi:hypothetical protein
MLVNSDMMLVLDVADTSFVDHWVSCWDKQMQINLKRHALIVINHGDNG